MYPDDPAQREHARQNILLAAYDAKARELRGDDLFVNFEQHEFSMIVALRALDAADKADENERKAARRAQAAELVAVLDKARARLADNGHDLDDFGYKIGLLLGQASGAFGVGETLGGGLMSLRFRQLADEILARYQTEEEFEAANGAPRWALEAEADYRNR